MKPRRRVKASVVAGKPRRVKALAFLVCQLKLAILNVAAYA
jgi:hypothetical protein